ncbi:hypothetical protein HOY80DRAFT_1051571 [Tuber brumale]|nr:hypothetical protein HOY80DRAFT_1051571 [Tuber brumale]
MSFAWSSVVLSCAIEKNFASEAEVSRHWYHILVLSWWLDQAMKVVAILTASREAITSIVISHLPKHFVVMVLGCRLDLGSSLGPAEELSSSEEDGYGFTMVWAMSWDCLPILAPSRAEGRVASMVNPVVTAPLQVLEPGVSELIAVEE